MMKQLPDEADVSEYLAHIGRGDNGTELDKAIRDLVLIAFYYLLWIGEYTVKTVQFKLEDVTFFKK